MGGVYLLGRPRLARWERCDSNRLNGFETFPKNFPKENSQKNDIFSSWVTLKFIRGYHQLVGRYLRVCIRYIVQESCEKPETRGQGLLEEHRSILRRWFSQSSSLSNHELCINDAICSSYCAVRRD